MTSVFSWQNSASLRPASFCALRPNLSVILGISWLSTLAFQFPMMRRTLFLVLVLEGLVHFHRSSQRLLQHQWLGHRLGLLNGLLGNKTRSFCCFWGCTQALHFRPPISVSDLAAAAAAGSSQRGTSLGNNQCPGCQAAGTVGKDALGPSRPSHLFQQQSPGRGCGLG